MGTTRYVMLRNEGATAAHDDIQSGKETKCPYYKNSQEWKDWMEGYHEVMQDAMGYTNEQPD